MRIVLQRVSNARVSVGSEVTGEISRGVLLLVGFGSEDIDPPLKAIAQKIAHLRIFPRGESSFDISLLDISGEVLLVPQFTLYGDTRKGRRPDFFSSLAPDKAVGLSDRFVEEFRALGLAKVATGRFGAHMQVALENDGPVTFMFDEGTISRS